MCSAHSNPHTAGSTHLMLAPHAICTASPGAGLYMTCGAGLVAHAEHYAGGQYGACPVCSAVHSNPDWPSNQCPRLVWWGATCSPCPRLTHCGVCRVHITGSSLCTMQHVQLGPGHRVILDTRRPEHTAPQAICSTLLLQYNKYTMVPPKFHILI